MSDQALCWMDGEILPAAQARISVLDHGLLYGDGIFEGIRFYHGQPFRLQPHLQRLLDSAKAIGLMLPMELDAIAAAVQALLAQFAGENGYLRMVVTRGVGPLGIDPAQCAEPKLFIIADQLRMAQGGIREQGASVIIASTRRLGADGLDPRIKSLNYLNHILARMEATRAGADEAVLLNAQGRVTEGTVENLFIVRDGILLTPPPIEGVLKGITRDCIIELANQQGIPFQETALAPYDLYTADECFMTGTGAELIPVREVDGRPLSSCPGLAYQKLQSAFQQLVAEECRP